MEEKEEFQKRYNDLSLELKEALFDKKNSEILREIGKRFNLPENSISDLAKISGKVFLGILPLPNIAKEIRKELNVGEETAQGLFYKLNLKIFSKYKESLEKEKKKYFIPNKIKPAGKIIHKTSAEELKEKIFAPNENRGEKEIAQKPIEKEMPETSFEKEDVGKKEENKTEKIFAQNKLPQEKVPDIPQVPMEKESPEEQEEKFVSRPSQNKPTRDIPAQNEKADTYQEPIETEEEETDLSQVIKEKGRIRGIF